MPIKIASYSNSKDDGPKAEHDLHLTEEMIKSSFNGVEITADLSRFFERIIRMLIFVRFFYEILHRKRMCDGEEKNHRHDAVERLRFETTGQDADDSATAIVHIIGFIQGKSPLVFRFFYFRQPDCDKKDDQDKDKPFCSGFLRIHVPPRLHYWLLYPFEMCQKQKNKALHSHARHFFASFIRLPL